MKRSTSFVSKAGGGGEGDAAGADGASRAGGSAGGRGSISSPIRTVDLAKYGLMEGDVLVHGRVPARRRGRGKKVPSSLPHSLLAPPLAVRL